MIINSLSASQVAASVWLNATRTLTADPATDAGAATLVWTHSVRQMSSWGASIFVLSGTLNGTITNSTTVDLRPASGRWRFASIACSNPGAGVTINMYDGTNLIPAVGVGANVAGGLFGGTSALGVALRNTSGSSTTYHSEFLDMVQ